MNSNDVRPNSLGTVHPRRGMSTHHILCLGRSLRSTKPSCGWCESKPRRGGASLAPRQTFFAACSGAAPLGAEGGGSVKSQPRWVWLCCTCFTRLFSVRLVGTSRCPHPRPFGLRHACGGPLSITLGAFDTLYIAVLIFTSFFVSQVLGQFLTVRVRLCSYERSKGHRDSNGGIGRYRSGRSWKLHAGAILSINPHTR